MKKKTIIISIIILFFIIYLYNSNSNSNNNNIDLYPANQIVDGINKWGFINKNGDYVINPIFDEVGTFQNGLAAYRADNKWGFINKNGKVQITAQFKDVKYFSEEKAPVTNDNKLWFYIDKHGNKINNNIFFYAGIFKNGKALISDDKDNLKTIISQSSTPEKNYIDYLELNIIDSDFNKIIIDNSISFHEPITGDHIRYISHYSNNYISLINRDNYQKTLFLIKADKIVKKFDFGYSNVSDIYRLGNANADTIPIQFTNSAFKCWKYINIYATQENPLVYDYAGDYIDSIAPVLSDYCKTWSYIDLNENIVMIIKQDKKWIPFVRSSENTSKLKLKNKLVFYNHNLSIIPLLYCPNESINDTFDKIVDIKYIDRQNNLIFPKNNSPEKTLSPKDQPPTIIKNDFNYYKNIFLAFTFTIYLFLDLFVIILLYHNNYIKIKFLSIIAVLLLAEWIYFQTISYYFYLTLFYLYTFSRLNYSIILFFALLTLFPILFFCCKKQYNQSLSFLILTIILLSAFFAHFLLGIFHIDNLETQISTYKNSLSDNNKKISDEYNNKKNNSFERLSDLEREYSSPEEIKVNLYFTQKTIMTVPKYCLSPKIYYQNKLQIGINILENFVLYHYHLLLSKIILFFGEIGEGMVMIFNITLRFLIVLTMLGLINYTIYMIIRITLTVKSFKPIDFKYNGNKIKYKLISQKSININELKPAFSNSSHLYISQKLNYLSGGKDISNINSFSIYSFGSFIARLMHRQFFFKSIPIDCDFNLRTSNLDSFIIIKLENEDTILYDIDSLVAFENTVKLGTYFDLINFFSIHSWILKKHFFYYISGPGLVILKAKNSAIEVNIDDQKTHKEIINNIVFLPAYCKIYSYVPEQPFELYTNYDYCVVESPKEQKLIFQNIEHESTFISALGFSVWKILKLFIVP
jgi:hypothetical protein